MTQTQDLCPISDIGNHRYFIFKVVEVFEPVAHVDYEPIDPSFAAVISLINASKLYEKVEYAISGCNCGSSIKQKVKQQ